jgi:hypothetical protein
MDDPCESVQADRETGMKWILLWFAVSSQGALTSGSAEFESSKACETARGAVQDTLNDISKELNNFSRFARSRCISSQTGQPSQG